MVIADKSAEFANQIFGHSDEMNGSALFLGAIFFTFQIYCDFSGYSDVALGTARLLGIELLRNFSFPYFSRDIAEFWRRWHISLSSWFRDYLYIPLGGSKGGTWMRIRNTFIIFIVSGFWHGANWTFIVWGALNALFIMPSIIWRTNRDNLVIVAEGRLLPTLKEFLSISTTFGLTVFAWIFFRAEDMGHAMSYIEGMFSSSLFSSPNFEHKDRALSTIILIGMFVVVEWLGRENRYAIERINLKKPVRYAFYYALVIAIFYFGDNQQAFIYFQF